MSEIRVFKFEVCPRCSGNFFPVDYKPEPDWKARAEKAETRVADLEAKFARAGAEVMKIIAAALSGDFPKYVLERGGNRYCKWGVVEKDILAIFQVSE